VILADSVVLRDLAMRLPKGARWACTEEGAIVFAVRAALAEHAPHAVEGVHAPLDLLVIQEDTSGARVFRERETQVRTTGLVLKPHLGLHDHPSNLGGFLSDAGQWWCAVWCADILGQTWALYQLAGRLRGGTEVDAARAFLINADGDYALDDPRLVARLREIITARRIRLVIETGINAGRSTVAFAQLAERVIGLDISASCIAHAEQQVQRAGAQNVALVQGSSPALLDAVLPGLGDALYFLDAHWGAYWPLRDEIACIAKHKPGKGVIVIHDFKVEGTGLSCDQYGGRVLCAEYLADVLRAWSPTYRIETNAADEALGSRVGVAFIFPE